MNELDLLRQAQPATAPTSTFAREELLDELHALSDISAVPRPGRRRLAIAAAGAPLVALAAGTATATGLVPLPFQDEYAQSFHDQPLRGQQGIDVSKATRAASTEGPAGYAFSVMVARGTGGYVCTAPLFERLPVQSRWPSDFEGGGSECHTATQNAPGGPFGVSGITPVRAMDAVMVSTVAGAAKRAEITTSDGRVIPMTAAEGWFYGWFPNPQSVTDTATLTGFDAGGKVLGSFELTGYDRSERLR